MDFVMLKAPFRYLSFSLPIVLLSILLSYFFIDQNLAIWVFQFGLHQQPGFSGGLDLIITQLAYCAVLPMFLVYFFCQVQNNNSKLVRCIGLISGSFSVAFFAKTTLQFLFGRYAPRYFDGKSLIFLDDPTRYGFHLLHGGGFPSGHMTVFTAALTSVCLYYPALRWLCGLLLFILACCLIAANYHFLSDIIAGTYLGFSISLAMHYLQTHKAQF
jgi:membrane-associated phospholipid phosphatase